MPPGRRLGTAAIRNEAARRKAMSRTGDTINAETARLMKQQLESFKRNLEQFAIQHKKEIQSDPAFRAKFHAMCSSIGVDPLTSRKGVWADLLGVGDYYYELAVRIIEVCVRTRPMNGGIMDLRELMSALRKARITYTENISSDDVERAIAKLDILSSGFCLVSAGGRRLVQSVPIELSVDHTKALSVCGEKGYISATELVRATGWDANRTMTTLNFLLQNEFAWLDLKTAEPTYWVLGLLAGSSQQT